MPESGAGRRAVYFAFQGLFGAVLLLIVLFQSFRGPGWMDRFLLLTAVFLASLAAIQAVDGKRLGSWYFQVGLFMGDAAAASIVLSWTTHDSDLYLLYVLIIFGTALMRSLTQSLVVAAVASGLYLVSALAYQKVYPVSPTTLLLRVNFLWVSSILLAILSRDSRQAQGELERRHRDRLVQFERLATLGQLAGEVAHRIKGPLTTIMVNAEVLSQRRHSPEEARELAQIREEVGHCRDILKGLLDLGRIEEMDEVRFDLREPLRRALAAVAPRLQKRRMHLAVSLAEPLPMRGDPVLMGEAVLALLHNAVEACRDGGRAWVSARVLPGRAGWLGLLRREALCEVSVRDDGRGIAPEHLERVFEPFFTTKGRNGTGLGLSAALRILQKHGGTIEVSSEGAGRGAQFLLSVPCRG